MSPRSTASGQRTGGGKATVSEGDRGEDGGVTHRVQGPGAEELDASREGLGGTTETHLHSRQLPFMNQ